MATTKRKLGTSDDFLNSNPILRSINKNNNNNQKAKEKTTPTKYNKNNDDDDFLNKPAFISSNINININTNTNTNTSSSSSFTSLSPSSSPLKSSPLKSSPLKWSPLKSSPSSPFTPSPISKNNIIRRSSENNDDFLYEDPFAKREEDGVEKREKLKDKLDTELSTIFAHLSSVIKGTVTTDNSEKYKKGGKDRKRLKWNLTTGGFSELEFDLVIELLQHHFPKCDMHFITDVLWQEAGIKLLIKRGQAKNKDHALRILSAVDLSSADKRELRRYKSDTSVLTTVAKYQKALDSPNSSQDKKKSKSPSSSQESAPSSQERQFSTKSVLSSSPNNSIDFSKYNFKKQNTQETGITNKIDITISPTKENDINNINIKKNSSVPDNTGNEKMDRPIKSNNESNDINSNNIKNDIDYDNHANETNSASAWMQKKTKTREGNQC